MIVHMSSRDGQPKLYDEISSYPATDVSTLSPALNGQLLFSPNTSAVVSSLMNSVAGEVKSQVPGLRGAYFTMVRFSSRQVQLVFHQLKTLKITIGYSLMLSGLEWTFLLIHKGI